MAAPTLLIADTTGATSGTITYPAGHANHVRLGDRTYQNLRTGAFEWHTSTQRCTPIGYRDSSWTWTASGANANAYYLRFGASTNPNIPNDTNRRVLENGTPLALGASVAALAAGEYFYGDADTLGYSTIYVRLSDSADPDSKATDYIQFDTLLWYLTAASGADPSIGSPTNRIVYIGDYIAGLASSSSTVSERQYYIGDLDTLGFNTIYLAPRQKHSSSEGTASWESVDTQTDGFVYQSYDNASFSWGAGGPATANRIRWDFKLAGVIVRTIYGFNAGCDLEHDAVTVTVENEDGLTSSATRVCSQTAFSGTTNYVATAGNDTTGDGSSGNPWATVAKAVTTLGASNSNRRIMLNGGDTHAWVGGSITGSNWIIDAYGTGTPTLDLSGSINVQGDNLAVRNVRIGASGGSAVTCFTATGTVNNGLTVANVIPFGNISSLANVDRIRTGILLRDVVCEDMSVLGGMRAYMIYTVSVATVVCDPCRMICLDGCVNDYGHRDEAAVRMGGDYVCIHECDFEQTNITSSLRTKSAGPRQVGGTHWYVSRNQFRIPLITTGLSLNGAQGVAGMTFAPADGQSFAVRWCIVERNLFLGCGFNAETKSAGQTTYTDDVTIRANVFDSSQYAKHAYLFVGLGGQHDATCARWIVAHNTFRADQDGTVAVRPLDFGEAPGLLMSDLTLENNLYTNPSLAIVNNDTLVPIFLAVRTADTGTSQFASVAHNVCDVPDTSAAAGNYAGTGASAFMARWRNSSGTNTHFWGFDDLNGEAYADDNTLEAVTLDTEWRISGSPDAATQAVRSTGVRYDFYGRAIPATGGAVGAVQPGSVYTVIQAGANVLALAR
jgi:hypothetical protein